MYTESETYLGYEIYPYQVGGLQGDPSLVSKNPSLTWIWEVPPSCWAVGSYRTSAAARTVATRGFYQGDESPYSQKDFNK